MAEYAEKIRNVTDDFEKEKHIKLAELRKQLAKERQRRKRELHEKHVKEAQQAGLDPQEVNVSCHCLKDLGNQL